MKNFKFSRQGTVLTIFITQTPEDVIEDMHTVRMTVNKISYGERVNSELLQNRRMLKKYLSDMYFNYWEDYVPLK
jgi:hypothetical protein